MGYAIVWFLAVMMILAVPAGVGCGVAAFRDDTQCLANRVLMALMGVALSASALAVIVAMYPAFVQVVINGN